MRLVIFENILTFRRPAWYTHTEVKIPFEHLFCSIWFSLEVLRIQWLEKVSSSGKIFKQKFHKIFIKSHDLVFPNFHTKESKKKRIKQLSSNQGNQKPMARTSKIFEKHLIIQNAKRFCKVQEEISRLVFSRMRLEIEMTDDDDQTIWKWFPIPELTNEPSWLVQCKKLLVKEGGFWFTTSPDLESIKILRIVDCQSFLWQDLLSFFLLWSPWP